MFLYLDPTKDEKLIFAIISKDKEIIKQKTFYTGKKKSEKILKFLEKFLEEVNLDLDDFNGLLIVKGEGRFIDIRISVLIFDIIGICKGIKVIGLLNKGDIKENIKCKFKYQRIVYPKYPKKQFIANLKV